jgi:ATP-dependent DNA helicase RecQ
MRGVWGSQMVACTATATESTAAEILECLHMQAAACIRMPMMKNNLHLAVCGKGSGRSASERLVRVLRTSTAQQAIVFCGRRDETERVAKLLQGNGLNAAAYHAGLENRHGIEESVRAGVSPRFEPVTCTGVARVRMHSSCFR